MPPRFVPKPASSQSVLYLSLCSVSVSARNTAGMTGADMTVTGTTLAQGEQTLTGGCHG